jgi:serine/threonine protein kinase
LGIPGITQTTLYGAAVAESVLSAAPQWVPGLIKTTGVVLGNYGVYQGTKACQNDPGSLECTMLITGIQMGWLDDLARETGAFLEDAYEATTFMAVQSLEDAQVAYSIDPNMRRLMNMSSEDPLMAAVDDVPSFVTLESGEVITVGEQVGSSGAQGSAYLGQTCTGETCIVKLFDLDDIPEGFTEEALNQINSIQIEIMSTFGTAENTFLPQYYGSVVDESGEAVGYAMEYISGTTASDVIQAQGGLTYEQANEIFDAVYSFQETTGLPHGDITNFGAGGTNLSNVILNAEGKAVLIDPVGSSMIINSLPTKEIIDSELYYLRNWIENSILE